MLVTPHGVCRLGLLADACVWVGEYEPNIEVRPLVLDQDVLLSVGGDEAAFGFSDDPVNEDEVRGISRRSGRLEVADDVALVSKSHAFAVQVFDGGLFKA